MTATHPEAAPGTVGIAVICKAPEAGRSKTRLSPPLLPEQCAALSACFIQDLAATIHRLCETGPFHGYALYTPSGTERALRSLLPQAFDLVLQSEGDFGLRLFRGIEDILARGHAGAIIVNADSPTLPPDILRAGAEQLMGGDRLVLSPALDGGYTFIGLSRPHRRLFEDIAWSTDHVYRQTVERAAEIGVDVCNVDPWYDIDDAVSLRMLQDELAGVRPAFSVSRHPLAPAPATKGYMERFPSQALAESSAR